MPREQVRQDPYPLPKDFEWTVLDINDPKQVSTISDGPCNSTDMMYRIKKSTISSP
jgi:hypothetical protein